jgi:predicted dienelactone hydrolase
LNLGSWVGGLSIFPDLELWEGPMNTKKAVLFFVSLTLISLALSACSPKEPFHLSEPGPYQFGTLINYKFIDSGRDNREINLYIWYPAIVPKDAEPSRYNFDAEPDTSGVPYPVILSSAKVGGYFGPHLATHGFIVIGVDRQDSKEHWGNWLIDYPLDQAAALDYVAANPPEGLDGMIDTDRAGAIGYSFDGYNALSLGGARVDPGFFQAQCAKAVPGDPEPESWWIDYVCNLDGGWESFVANAGPGITESSDGLWQPLTDPRIKAVMPMAPEGAWLFGEKGLGAGDRPTLILAATADEINYYNLESVYIFENLGASDKSMISFVDQDHMMIFGDDEVAKMKHFAVGFFGFHLGEKADYAEYFSENFISQFDYLAWGVYKE